MFPPHLIVADRIGNDLELSSKKRLLERLGMLLASIDPDLSPEGVFGRLCERERLGSTGLGHGVALPHARMQEVTEAVGAFVQLRKGVAFDALDNGPVDLAFGLLVPESVTELHLQLLAQLASMFKDPRLRQDLRRATSAEQILALLEGQEQDLRNQ
ncbi:PTS sugar transporter subunit IIA [Candidatus Thiosymbion oneisti]|uniref:PTS sugar transporter subunit IIA n=1 Tax=Candidatus Thiosymbion oneisti TaxID=589554 RepID=UPI000A44D827|nr:PTS sugar transporter subunit IIA [Candidatus Thiosymbion oneisti]